MSTHGAHITSPTHALHDKAFVQPSLTCQSHVEIIYYGSELGISDIPAVVPVQVPRWMQTSRNITRLCYLYVSPALERGRKLHVSVLMERNITMPNTAQSRHLGLRHLSSLTQPLTRMLCLLDKAVWLLLTSFLNGSTGV